MSYKIRKKKKLDIPELSIIIPVKDALAYLDKCLASLEKIQEVECEIIIVNDGSGPEVTHYLEKFPQLNIVHNQQTLGFVESCHLGVKRSVGKYILLLNSDTEIIEKKSFRYMLDCLKNKNVGVVGAKLLYPNDTIQHFGLVWDNKQMNYTHFAIGKDKNDPIVCINQTFDVISGACFMVSRELWNKLGGFDKIYSHGYWEDTDFCLRAKELGYINICCAEALLYHYQSKSFSGGPTKEHFGRNHEIFKQRWIRNNKIKGYVKISACYITKNSEEFIAYSIKSIYDMVAKIIVVDNSSKDKTLEILKNMQFNDPQNKITVISREFQNKTEQRNTYCQMLDGMYFAWIVDSDEVWSCDDLRKVEHLIFGNPQIPSFCFNFIDFWKDLAHVSKGIWETFVGRKSLINLNICGKIKYNTHTLPVLVNDGEIPSVFAQDIYFHHYSYVRTDKQIKDKIDYYINTGTPGFEQQKNWYEKVWLAWDKDPIRVEKELGTHLFGGGWTELYNGQHPEVMKTHPRFLEYVDKFKTKINMTVSPREIPQFINISIKNDDIFDIGKKIGKDRPYLVLIEDILEHISFNAVGELLVKIHDRMEVNGEIIIKTLNMDEVIKRYAERKIQYVDFIKLAFGEQVEANDYHSCLYTEEAIKALLEDVGFMPITIDRIENGLFLYAIAKKHKDY